MVGCALLHGGGHGLFAHEQVRRVQAVNPSRRRLNIQRPDSVLDDVRSGGVPFYGSARDDDRFPGWFQTKPPPGPFLRFVTDSFTRVFHVSRVHSCRCTGRINDAHVSLFAVFEDVRGVGVVD